MGIDTPFLKENNSPWDKNPPKGSARSSPWGSSKKDDAIPGKPAAGFNSLNKITSRETARANQGSFNHRENCYPFAANGSNQSAFPYKQPPKQQPHLGKQIADIAGSNVNSSGKIAAPYAPLVQASDLLTGPKKPVVSPID